MEDILTLYKNIKNRRQELGLSQEELAKKVGYKDRTSIAKIEGGKVDLSQSKIIEFANVLGVPPSYLMGWDNATVSEQIKKFREQKGLTQEELSAYSFTPLERIVAFENEEAMPEGREISFIAQALDVSIFDIYPNMPVELYKETYTYLKNAEKINDLMSEGLISFLFDIYGKAQERITVPNKYTHYWEIGLPPNTFILTENDIEHLKEVSKTSIKMAADYLGKLNEAQDHIDSREKSEESSAKHDISEMRDTKIIPLYPRLASAGEGQYIFDDIPFDMVKVDSKKYKKADYAIQVNGDSMEPTYYDGDTLIVERNAIPEIGKTGIFIVDGMGYVKRMGNGELISDNKAYNNIVGEYSKCLGKVLGKV